MIIIIIEVMTYCTSKPPSPYTAAGLKYFSGVIYRISSLFIIPYIAERINAPKPKAVAIPEALRIFLIKIAHTTPSETKTISVKNRPLKLNNSFPKLSIFEYTTTAVIIIRRFEINTSVKTENSFAIYTFKRRQGFASRKSEHLLRFSREKAVIERVVAIIAPISVR